MLAPTQVRLAQPALARKVIRRDCPARLPTLPARPSALSIFSTNFSFSRSTITAFRAPFVAPFAQAKTAWLPVELSQRVVGRTFYFLSAEVRC